MTKTITIYHNPRCSKSRASLAIIENCELEADIQLYLQTPPSAAELGDLLDMLGGDINTLLRKGEAVYKALENPPPLSDTQAWLEVIADNPIVLQRPIVVLDGKAVIGRPPENVEELIGESA